MIKTALSSCALVLVTATFAQSNDQLVSNELFASSNELQQAEPAIVRLVEKELNSITLGTNSSATGKYSVAIGSGASATEDNTMVLGGTTEESRVSVGIGTSHPSSLAALDLGDSDKGLLVNRMTAEQVEFFEMSLGIAEEGMTIYNIDAGKLQTWNGTNWIDLGVKKMTLSDDKLQLDKRPVVDLSEYRDNTDQQSLSSATLDGKQLTIGIENGESVSVDLTPIFAEYDERIRKLEELLMQVTSEQSRNEETRKANAPVEARKGAMLYQNTPNPVNGPTTVRYFIPKDTRKAQFILRNSLGQVISTKKLAYTGTNGEEQINTSKLSPGVYYFSLFVDDIRVDTKKMIVK